MELSRGNSLWVQTNYQCQPIFWTARVDVYYYVAKIPSIGKQKASSSAAKLHEQPRINSKDLRESNCCHTQHVISESSLGLLHVPIHGSQHFNNEKEVEVSVKEFFALKDKNWYQCGIEELAERWLQMVQHHSLYFEY